MTDCLATASYSILFAKRLTRLWSWLLSLADYESSYRTKVLSHLSCSLEFQYINILTSLWMNSSWAFTSGDRASQTNGEASTTTDQDGRGWWNGISSQTLWGSHPHCRKKITSLRTIITMLKRLHSREWVKCISIRSMWRKNLYWHVVQVLAANVI